MVVEAPEILLIPWGNVLIDLRAPYVDWATWRGITLLSSFCLSALLFLGFLFFFLFTLALLLLSLEPSFFLFFSFALLFLKSKPFCFCLLFLFSQLLALSPHRLLALLKLSSA